MQGSGTKYQTSGLHDGGYAERSSCRSTAVHDAFNLEIIYYQFKESWLYKQYKA